MKFTPTWYKNPSFTGIPSFQEIEDITGMAYDDKGNYIGPKEKPKMQLVLDQTTNRQYWAPEEYDDDAVKYGAALLNKDFNSEDWWGMVYDPHLTKTQKVSVALIEGLKQGGKFLLKAPTEIVAGASGISDAMGINIPVTKTGPNVATVAEKIGKGASIAEITEESANAIFRAVNPIAYLGSNLARKGIKASANDFVDIIKSMKSPKGEMGETARLYRASAQNWEATLDKYLPDVDDNIKAHSTLVTIASMAGQIGGSLLLAAATSGVGGLPAVAGVFGSQQFYSMREEYLQKGYSLQSANIYAGLAAVSEGGLEAVGFNHWLKYATLKPSLRNHLIAGFMEASQEASQTTAEELIANLSGVREETLAEILANISIAAIAGFIPGAGISAVGGGLGIRKEKAGYELNNALEAPKTVKMLERGEVITGPGVKTELELSKANKGSNPLYDTVRNIAVSYGVNNEKAIDGFYYYARNKRVQGITSEALLEGLGKQIVAYNKQLLMNNKTADSAGKKAAADISYHLSEEAVNKFRENTKSAAKKSGLSPEEAERVAMSESNIYEHLSKEFGEDVANVKQVEIVVPEVVEGKKMTLDEALAEAQTIEAQIAELSKLEGAEQQIAKLEEEKVNLLNRGYINLGDTINKITLTRLSDVSTIKHEFMHHWDDIIELMAAKGNKKAQQLKAAKDKIIEKNWAYVKQGGDEARKRAEVLTEAYEAWLYSGVVAEDGQTQGLFEAMARYFRAVYESVKDITGVRINPEIDLFFRQMTGLASIGVQEDVQDEADMETLQAEGKVIIEADGESGRDAKQKPFSMTKLDGESGEKQDGTDSAEGDFLARQTAKVKKKLIALRAFVWNGFKPVSGRAETPDITEKLLAYMADEIFETAEGKEVKEGDTLHSIDKKKNTHKIHFVDEVKGDAVRIYNKKVIPLNKLLVYKPQYGSGQRMNGDKISEALYKRLGLEGKDKQNLVQFLKTSPDESVDFSAIKGPVYDFEVAAGERLGFNQKQRRAVAKQIIEAIETGSLFSRSKVTGTNTKDFRLESWTLDAPEAYRIKEGEPIRVPVPDSRAVFTVARDARTIRGLFKALGITVKPKKAFAKDRFFQEGINMSLQRAGGPVPANDNVTVVPLPAQAYDKNGKADINTPEFKAWSGNSNVVSAKEAESYHFETGKPVTLEAFHGSPYGNITQFDVKKQGSSTRAIDTNGFFFTNSWSSADNYTRSVKRVNQFDERKEKLEKELRDYIVDIAIKYNPQAYGKNARRLFRRHATDEQKAHVAELEQKITNAETQANNTRASNATIYPVYLRIQNPLVIEYGTQEYDGDKLYDYIEQAKREGNDGLIIKNIADGGEEMGVGEHDYVVFEPTQIKSVYNRGSWDKNNPNIFYQTAYHGTPHRFDGFSLAHIGSGEGAQAHGWGLYFAADKDVAKGYRKDLSQFDRNNVLYGGKPFAQSILATLSKEYETYLFGLGKQVALDEVSSEIANVEKSLADKGANPALEKYLRDIREQQKILQAIDEAQISLVNVGQVFEVDIPENHLLLDENKLFGQQPEEVRAALEKVFAELTPIQKKMFLDKTDVKDFKKTTGKKIYSGLAYALDHTTEFNGAQAASELLNRNGIKGITYDGAQDGRGYVIFDDKAISIQQTFYQTVRAQQTGTRAADSKPGKEQIAKDLAVIKQNGVEKYEPKSGVWSSFANWGKGLLLSVRQRAGAIDPKLKAFFDKLDFFQPNLEKKFASKTAGFIKKFQALVEEEKNELDYYIYNQLQDKIDAFLKQHNMTQEYQDVRGLLNFIYAIANRAGIDMGFIEEYFPTSMIDYAGFLTHMKGTDKWSTISQALQEADPKGIWSDQEKAAAVNNLLRGYRLDPVQKPKNANERQILYKSPELMRFYEHSDVALIKYLHGMSQAIAINKAFGKGSGFDTEATIGGIVLELIESGTITYQEEPEIRRLLKSRLSYAATPEFIRMIKNVGYLQTMNNFTSAITQLGDLYAPFYKYSFGTAIEALFGKSEITAGDLGLDKIWEEFSDESKTGIAVDKLFKVVGLEKLDRFGKEVALKASLINLRKQAANGNLALLNRLSYTFGNEAGVVLKEIKSGKITDNVKILMWADLADTQPIGRSGVPAGYLDYPHGRLFYQLKTFTLNQLSLFYADSLVNIQKGIKYKNKKQFLKGVQNGFKLLLLLTAGNATADVLKNIIMGREIDVSDTVVSNLLWNIGVSKYTFYKGKRDGYVRAILSSYLMPPQVSAFDDTWIDARKIASGKRELKDTTAVTYLPFGRAYYWWFGGGRTSEEKKKEKKK